MPFHTAAAIKTPSQLHLLFLILRLIPFSSTLPSLMPFNPSAPAFVPKRPKRNWPTGPSSSFLRRSERYMQAARRQQPSIWPLEYLTAPQGSLLAVHRSIVEHCRSLIVQNNPADVARIRREQMFSFAIDSTSFTHAIIKADAERNQISLVVWYENGTGCIFKPDAHCFFPITNLTMTLDAANTECGEIEYTYDHSPGQGQIEYGHVSFNAGWKAALSMAEFF